MVKIFIGNLARDDGAAVITGRDLKPLFDDYGTVTECVVLETKGYGFVHMPHPKEAKKAIRDLDGWQVAGQRIHVELSNDHGTTKPTSAKSVPSSKGAIPKAGTNNRNTSKVDDLSSSINDCYFFQTEECTRESNCPYLHRTLPQTVCRKFVFGKCKRPTKCPKQHLSPSCLPPPPDREVARVKAVKHGHACMMIRKKEERSLGESNGAIKKTVVSGMKKKKMVPEMSLFLCLDCGVTATSCFLLESHLNTDEHWEKVKQVKLEERELRGVVLWCDVCGVKVKQGEMEVHKKEGLHMAMLERSAAPEDWSTVGGKLPKPEEEEDNSEDIHVMHIPHNMSLNIFKQICLQFGQVTKLKFLPKGRHAYVRYSTEEAREFALIKLKELQKSYFAGASEHLISLEESDSEEYEEDVAKVVVFRNGGFEEGFACNLCEAVCNSMKQHKLHMRSHELKMLKEEESLGKSVDAEDPLNKFLKSIGIHSKPSLSSDLNFTESEQLTCPSSSETEIMDENLSQLLSLSQLNMVKEEEENKLKICQNQMKMSKQAGADIGQTLKLLEEELEIQRTLRDIERDVQEMKGQLNTSSNNNITVSNSLSSLGSKDSLTLHRKSQNQGASSQLARYSDLDNATRYKSTTSKTYFSPDDVFNSDDSFDEEESDQFLLSQNLILNEAECCPVNKQKPYQMEELRKYLDAIDTMEVPYDSVENSERVSTRRDWNRSDT